MDERKSARKSGAVQMLCFISDSTSSFYVQPILAPTSLSHLSLVSLQTPVFHIIALTFAEMNRQLLTYISDVQNLTFLTETFHHWTRRHEQCSTILVVSTIDIIQCR